jgi:ABC-type transporter Mla subunit MlaD
LGERGIFNEIREALDEVMAGRRYLISEIEKLKKALPDLGPEVEKLMGAIDSISQLSEIARGLSGSLTDLRESLSIVKTLSTTVQSMKNDLSNMSNNVMALRPILDSIRDYSQRNENGLRGMAQAMQTIMGQLGEVLAKLGR